MSLVTWGWGTCDGIITVWGFGSFPCVEIPEIIAKYLLDRAYVWVSDDRGWVEVISRDKGDIMLRLKPGSIPSRLRMGVMERIREDAPIRSPGWPWEFDEFNSQRQR
jgi:hypothetical protein